MADSFVFYKSFHTALAHLDAETYKAVMSVICDYAFTGELPECNGVVAMAFELIKPQLDANTKRRENGMKGADYGKMGGRPKKETPKKPLENPKETPKKPLENPKETPNVNVNVNDNVNANVNVNENANANANANELAKASKEKVSAKADTKKKACADEPKTAFGEFKNVLLTDKEFSKLAEEYGQSRRDEDIEFLSAYMVEKPKYSSASHYLSIRRWVHKAVGEQKQRDKRAEPEDRYQVIRDWAGENYDATGIFDSGGYTESAVPERETLSG